MRCIHKGLTRRCGGREKAAPLSLNVGLGNKTLKSEIFKVIILSLSVSMLAGGCSESDSLPSQDNPPSGQDTPAELARKWGKAQRTNDLKAFLESCTPKHGDWPKAQAAALSIMTSAYHFKKALLKRHGADAWERYQAYGQDRSFMHIDEIPDDESWTQNLQTVEIDGKMYFYRWDNDRHRIVCRDGVWYFDFTYHHINKPSRIASKYFRLSRMLEQVARKVEENNASIESAAEMINKKWAD